MGARGTAIGPVRTALKEIALAQPDDLRDYLLNTPLARGGRLYCDRLLEGVDAGRRDCLRLYAEAMGWVGAQVNIGALLVTQVGATMPVAREAVRVVQGVESMTEEEQIGEAAEFLQARGWSLTPPVASKDQPGTTNGVGHVLGDFRG